MVHRLMPLAIAVMAVLGGCRVRAAAPSGSPRAAMPAVPTAELNIAADRRALVDSARALMRADSNVALVSVDEAGQPRVRTVKAFVDPPDAADPAGSLTVWIMTRLTTRKVGQIRGHPQVTLYFNDDAKVSYATVMGVATVHTDPNHPGAKRHYDDGYVKYFWPDFPRDFVMIEVRARWLEYMGPGIRPRREQWRPQAVIFEP